ncbi:hypothetical protein F2P56_035734 [Juglans regia]|uniref:Uncharacterized protein LOC108986760 n=2 Tax=Juglans regia TaxID=51240 RepID=A0A2I4E6L9_JUGRE|nr:uncharacterized protein LOC108986760 [Juglans regia]KAF5443150.1 hypothetical protein F2P56_035734 [Juglans regia]
MQAGSVLSLPPSVHLYQPSTPRYAQVDAKVGDDFSAKLKFEAFGSVSEEPADEGCSKGKVLDELVTESAAAGENGELRDEFAGAGENGEEEEEEDEDDDDEEEFSFACTNPDGSPISADDVFVDGQIRPVYPIFNQDLLFADVYDGDSKAKDAKSSPLRPPLRKLFLGERGPPRPSSSSESEELESEGPYCVWSGKAVEASPQELSKKSNSTGFSKLRRFRDLVLRSNSDGHDAFVLLNHPSGGVKPTNETTASRKNDNVEKARVSAGTGKAQSKGQGSKGGATASSAHEKHYMRNRARREGDKRKSYLPYRQDLVGFFTNVNGFSRNVHPF